MAVNESSASRTGVGVGVESFNAACVPLAGWASAVLGLGGMVGLIAYMLTRHGVAMGVLAMLGAWAFVFGVVAFSGVCLAQGRRIWAQQLLLAFWLLTAIAGLLLLTLGILYGPPPWWGANVGVGMTAASVILAAASCAMAYLTARVSAADSRLRYGTVASATGAAALAAMCVVNLLAQSPDMYYRKDVETLGQFRLSERSIRILKDVHEPLRVTMVYTSTDPKKRTAELRDRLWELLKEMGEQNPNVTVDNASSDADKANILIRLAERQNLRDKPQIELLNEFVETSREDVALMHSLADQWDKLAGKSYLDLWGDVANASNNLNVLAQSTEETAGKIKKELTGPADHTVMVADANDIISLTHDTLQAMNDRLERLAKVPAAVAANGKVALGVMEAAVKAVEALSKNLTDSDDPNAASTRLKEFVDSAAGAADIIDAAAGKLGNLAGPDNERLLGQSKVWLVQIGDASMGGAQLAASLDGYIAAVGSEIRRDRLKAENTLKNAKPEFQAKTVKDLRTIMTQLLKPLRSAADTASSAVAKLGGVDADTSAMLQAAQEHKLYEGLIRHASKLLDEIKKLPPLKASNLAVDLAEDNTVILETADRTDVVPFDQVWPSRARSMAFMSNPDQEEQRTFNGDSAVSSHILAMIQKPFARVLMTYLEMPPQMQRMMRGDSGITPAVLEEVKRRLEGADFRVDTWDLAKEMPEANDPADRGLKTVLLVLPPPPSMPPMGMGQEPPSGLTKEHIAKVKHAIDEGASALFLAQYLMPMSMGFGPPMPRQYEWNEYLKDDWGLEAQTGDLVIPAMPDEQTPGRFLFAPLLFRALRLSTFNEDSPIGKPLMGQRLMWTMLCPVRRVDRLPDGVTAQALLTVPSTWTSTWATSDIERVGSEIEGGAGGTISPDYAAGDIAAPFNVAMTASRIGDANRGIMPSRFVLMGTGAGLVDSYLTEKTPVVDERGGLKTLDPPRANLDLVVNSVYWLAGHQDYIAPGPMQLQPVRNISDVTRNVLWALCVIVLPLCVLGAGGLVLLGRRRS